LVPDFDPPLLEDAIQRARNWAHAEGVKKKKEEGKKKEAEKARRKEEHDKRRELQREAREEELSSIEDGDDDDDEEETHQYDWLDSMAEKGEQPRGHPSRSKGDRRRLNCCVVNRRTPTLGELRRWAEGRSP
jgi:hypothetical protein